MPVWPSGLPISPEVDLYGLSGGWHSEDVDPVAGQGSAFHVEHGFYIDAVGALTAVVPPDWRVRAKKMVVDVYGRPVTALILGPNDLALSKYVAWREKDRIFTAGLAKLGLADRETLLHLAETMEPVLARATERGEFVVPTIRDLKARIEADFHATN